MAFHVNAQETAGERSQVPATGTGNAHYVDTLTQKVRTISETGTKHRLSDEVAEFPDSISQDNIALQNAIRQRVDSLTMMGFSSDSLQRELQNILSTPRQGLEPLLAFQERLEDKLHRKVSALDTLERLQNMVKERTDLASEIGTQVGVGPLGKDMMPDVNALGSDITTPRSPAMDIMEGPLRSTDPNLGLTTEVLKPDLDFSISGFTKENGALKQTVSGVTDVANEAHQVAKEVDVYGTDMKSIHEEGLRKSEKIDELAEEQVLRNDQLRAFKEQNKGIKEAEAYKKLIEQYKNEKKIQEEMKAKAKELANDVIIKNNVKVDDAMKTISKYKGKFSDVPDLRNLPKRAPNPLKNSPWRERIVPGLTLQTLNIKKVWLQLDPQVYYKVNESWSVGAGGMYRFSMNPPNITFGDFGSLYGGKAFTQYAVFKGFFIRGELQFVRWKPWRWSVSDPKYMDRTYVGAIGIGKGYMLAKRIKGNAQTLYHWHSHGKDPYGTKIMIRLGFDLTLQKKKARPWAEQWKELRKRK